METSKKNLIITLVILLLLILFIFSSLSDNDNTNEIETNTTPTSTNTNEQSTIEEDILEEKPEDESTVQTVDKTPEWMGKAYTIDNEDFDYLSVQRTNLWKSYDDRTLVTYVNRYEKVTLLGYDSENDYCYVEYKNNKGWCACAWLANLPTDMVDY